VDPNTVDLYACSLPGALPSGHLSWFRAKRACEAMGKRLCDAAEWGDGCTGGLPLSYPYGSLFQGGFCNDGLYGEGERVQTGTYQECISETGTLDMSGNLSEWVNEWPQDFPGTAHVGGGHYLPEICYVGEDCQTVDENDIMELDHYLKTLDCRLAPRYYEVFPAAVPRLGFGTRCCLSLP
jgi:hypothetical protein